MPALPPAPPPAQLNHAGSSGALADMACSGLLDDPALGLGLQHASSSGSARAALGGGGAAARGSSGALAPPAPLPPSDSVGDLLSPFGGAGEDRECESRRF